jgi:hypothetical protein
MQLKTFEHPFFLTCNSHLLEMMVQIVAGKLDETCIHHSAAFQARERERERERPKRREDRNWRRLKPEHVYQRQVPQQSN